MRVSVNILRSCLTVAFEHCMMKLMHSVIIKLNHSSNEVMNQCIYYIRPCNSLNATVEYTLYN